MSDEVLESVIERDLVDKARAHNILCWKFRSSVVGVPDRILIGHHVITGKPVVAFIEVKRPGGKPRPKQLQIINRMIEHGAIISVTDSRESNSLALNAIFGTNC